MRFILIFFICVFVAGCEQSPVETCIDALSGQYEMHYRALGAPGPWRIEGTAPFNTDNAIECVGSVDHTPASFMILRPFDGYRAMGNRWVVTQIIRHSDNEILWRHPGFPD